MDNKWKIIITAVILAASAIFVTVLLVGSSQDPKFILEDGSLTISCQFGITVPVGDISNLELTSDKPQIETRTNGASLGGMHKGEYTLTGGEEARLYINENAPVFICFNCGGIVYYLSDKTEDDTRALFSLLQAAQSSQSIQNLNI